jgi:hypothetical protein
MILTVCLFRIRTSNFLATKHEGFTLQESLNTQVNVAKRQTTDKEWMALLRPSNKLPRTTIVRNRG